MNSKFLIYRKKHVVKKNHCRFANERVTRSVEGLVLSCSVDTSGQSRRFCKGSRQIPSLLYFYLLPFFNFI